MRINFFAACSLVATHAGALAAPPLRVSDRPRQIDPVANMAAFLVSIDSPCAGSADIYPDGFVNGIDFDTFAFAFTHGDCSIADYNHDSFCTGADFDLFVHDFELGCL